MKRCSKCKKHLTLNWFTSRKERKSGLRSSCRICNNTRKSLWHQRNKQKVYLDLQMWRKNNPDKLKRQLAIRRAVNKIHQPLWLSEWDLFVMEEIYDLCRLKSKHLGQKYHVDHIVPLQGKNVSGLNVPWNLRIIPAIDNMRKNNSWPI